MYLFLEREEGREKERDRNIEGCLLYVPHLRIEPVAQAFSLS